MKKNTTTNGKGQTIEERRAARIERWRKYAANHIANISKELRELLEAVASAAGSASPVDFIVEQLKAERGLDPTRKSFEAEYNLKSDDEWEDVPPLARNNHDRETACFTVSCFYHVHTHGLTHQEQLEMIRRYFVRGDVHLAQAEARAVRDALQIKPTTANG